jgi:hypothetical protein
MYYLKHKQVCFIRAQHECFISGKARTANVLSGLKNDPSDGFIGEVILKINVV